MATAAPDTTATPPLPLRERLLGWKEILETANPPKTRPLDTVGKWLVITRAAVFPMTIWSGLIGGLLAVEANRVAGGAAGRLGPVPHRRRRARARPRREQHDQRLLRHDRWRRHRRLRPGALCAASDPVGLGDEAPARDRRSCWSTPSAPRSCCTSRAVRGPLIIAFALAGLFISVFYVAPPIRLKHHGLGEPGVFLVWGPLMVGGTFLAATGTIAPWVLLVSVPYALLVTSVLFGKHIDKIEADGALGVRTLPVILGETRARAVGRWLMIAFYPLTILSALVGLIGPWVLLVVLGIPRLLAVLRVFRSPKPAAPPPDYPTLAAVVRRLRVRPHAPGRRPADAWPAAERAGADRAALGLGQRRTRRRDGGPSRRPIRLIHQPRASRLQQEPARRSVAPHPRG